MTRAADRSRSSAGRMRRHRQLVLNGRMIVAVEIDDTAVPAALVSEGFLRPDACDDKRAIGRAIERVIAILVAGDASRHDP